MGKAKIMTDADFECPPEATQPEDARADDHYLNFNIHSYVKKYGHRVDANVMFTLSSIKAVYVYLGANGGFKGIILNLHEHKQNLDYKISKTHKNLARKICRLLKKKNIPIIIRKAKRRKTSS